MPPSQPWAARGKQLTSQASGHSQEVLLASSDVPVTSWSQFYCFYYLNSFPSGPPYLPMQNWFRDATFGAHYVVMATRILQVYFSSSAPFHELSSISYHMCVLHEKQNAEDSETIIFVR